jgi:hypothetical protein
MRNEAERKMKGTKEKEEGEKYWQREKGRNIQVNDNKHQKWLIYLVNTCTILLCL